MLKTGPTASKKLSLRPLATLGALASNSGCVLTLSVTGDLEHADGELFIPSKRDLNDSSAGWYLWCEFSCLERPSEPNGEAGNCISH